MPTTPPEPLLLLCGGLSRRMGSPKALLNYRGQSLIARQVADALPHRPVWLAAAGSHYADTDGAVYLPDALPAHQGPLAALLPALQRAQQHGHRGLYVLACDTLLQPQAVIRVLQQAHHSAAWADGVVLLADGNRPHPLQAHWSANLAAPLHAYLNAGGRKVMGWLDNIPCQQVAMPPAWPPLANFNTRADFDRAVAVLEQMEQA